MSNLKLPSMCTYADAEAFLGDKRERKVGHNTYARFVWVETDSGLPEFDIAVRYHDTDIVTYHVNGDITLDTGGWDTSTTVNRMQQLTPAHIRVNHRFKRDGSDAWTIITDTLHNKVWERFTTLTLTPPVNA